MAPSSSWSCTAALGCHTKTQHNRGSEQGWAQSPEERGRLVLLPRKRYMKLYLLIYIFLLQTQSSLKSTADGIFQLICLYVILGRKRLKSCCVTWIVCVALCIVLLCQLLLRHRNQSTVVERNNVSSYLLPLQKIPTSKRPERSVSSELRRPLGDVSDPDLKIMDVTPGGCFNCPELIKSLLLAASCVWGLFSPLGR